MALFTNPGQRAGMDPRMMRLIETLYGRYPKFQISSGQRDKAYNRRIGSTDKSMHIPGLAADFDLSKYNDTERSGIIADAMRSGATRAGGYTNMPGVFHVDMAPNYKNHYMWDKTKRNIGSSPDWFQKLAHSPIAVSDPTAPQSRPNIGPDINFHRPLLNGPNNEAQSEASETFQAKDGKWFNRSTVGEPIPTGGPFNTLREAEASARMRSNVINQVRQPQSQIDRPLPAITGQQARGPNDQIIPPREQSPMPNGIFQQRQEPQGILNGGGGFRNFLKDNRGALLGFGAEMLARGLDTRNRFTGRGIVAGSQMDAGRRDKRDKTNATIKYMEDNNAPQTLLDMARSGAVAEAFKLFTGGKPKRNTAMGADGFLRDVDTGERVFPGIKKPPKERETIKGADGYEYWRDTGERVLPGVERLDPDVRSDAAQAQAIERAQAGKTSIVNNIGPTGIDYGKPEEGLAWARNPDGSVKTDERGAPIGVPYQGGSVFTKKEAARIAAEIQTDTRTVQGAEKSNTMLDAIASIEDLLENKSGFFDPVTGTASRLTGWYSGSDAGKLRSHNKTLESGVAIQTMMRLKEASESGATGFGQLNRTELQMLLDDMGSLDPDNTDPEIYAETISRIKGRFNRVVEDIRRNVNVSPERMQELGLDELLRTSDERGNVSTERGNVSTERGNVSTGVDDLLKKYGQ